MLLCLRFDTISTTMIKSDIQQEVRIRDRFICPNCCERRGEQYAHIIPDSDGGLYIPSNLLFLCAECHNNLEPARAMPNQKKRLIELAKKLKDIPREDGLLTSNFTLTTIGAQPRIRLGGGMTLPIVLPYSKSKTSPKILISNWNQIV